jgi:hypothetical protein
MWLPLITHDPVEALTAIVDVRQQALETACHFPTDARLNMLIKLRFRQTL